MIEKWMRGLAKARWFVVILWVVLTAGSVLVMPDLTEIAKQTETKFIPSDAESMQANDLLNKISVDDKEQSNAVLVLHRDAGLTESDKMWLKNKIEELKRNKEQLGLLSIHSAYDDPNLADKFESKDKTTEMVAIGFPKAANVDATQQSVDHLRDRAKDVPQGATAHLTGSAPIMKDYTQTSQDGLKKTEFLTIALVVVILLAVFRSPIAPLIPLITIALSFVFARGFVAWATKFGMPVSSFTETFLVATLFGAGTDYCILLIHRFREELSKGLDRVDALIVTMKTVGKTVVYSASTVLIAFFLIGFAKFGLYQSAVGVCIGMAATLLAGLTLTPALLLIFGPKLYWPFQIKVGQAGHHDSKLWGALANMVSKKPLVVLLVTVLVLSPVTLLFTGARSFDDIAEIDPSIGSVQGFRQVEKAFSSGEIMPITVAISTQESMRTPEGLAALEKASAAAVSVDSVKEVRSAARPLGEQVKELTVPDQLSKSTRAIGDMKDGVDKIADGLGQATSQVKAGADGVTQLRDGLSTIADKQQEVASGTSQIALNTAKVATGLKQGAAQLQGGLGDVKKMQDGLTQMAGSTKQAQQSLQQSQGGLTQTQQGLKQLGQGVGQAKTTAGSMAEDLQQLVKVHPELAQDPSVQALMGKQQGLTQALGQVEQGVTPLDQGLTQISGGLGQVAGGLGQLAVGQTQAASGVGQLYGSLQQFAGGVNQGTDALLKLSDGAKQASSGLHQLADGTGTISSKVGDLQSGLGQLSKGLGDGKDGLVKVADGLSQVHDAQKGIADNSGKQIAGWYLPDSALKTDDFKKAMNAYISPDGKIAKLEIVLSINPYSEEAMKKVDVIRNSVAQSLHGTPLQHANLKLTGTTAQDQELSDISNHDFMRTGALIVLGIYVVLALLLRSVVAPLYLLASLLFSYLVTMGLIEAVFVKWLGHPGLSWTVSFFAFILLVALGVDYSIFLMARFKEEYRPGGVVAAMQKAMKSTGGVILSAAVIMGGTFGAMVFSGVTAMAQIGAAIVIGLLVYTTIIMGLIVPALAMLFGEGNWWPLGGKQKAKKEEAIPSSVNL